MKKIKKRVMAVLCACMMGVLSFGLSSCGAMALMIGFAGTLIGGEIEFENGKRYRVPIIENDMKFWKGSTKETEHSANAGALRKDEYETYFIPMTVQNYTVTRIGSALSAMDKSIAAETGELKLLKKVYLPGSIETYYHGYFSDTSDLEVFCCSDVVDWIYVYNDSQPTSVKAIYCPEEIYEENSNIINPGIEKPELCKGNVSYRLNAEELPKYYYVDSVDYGQKIANVPPAPQRTGYTFEGWYTEPTYEQEWNFAADMLPLLAEGEVFKELNLYAKWAKA